jgi:hypothetical protein
LGCHSVAQLRRCQNTIARPSRASSLLHGQEIAILLPRKIKPRQIIATACRAQRARNHVIDRA